MGDNVFQPPPVPTVHVGGSQPYAPNVNPAIKPGWSVDSPKPDADVDTNARIIAQAWQAEPWPYVFSGGAQPYGTNCLNTAIKPGWSVDKPLPDADTEVNAAIVNSAWQTTHFDSWPYRFTGGAQPYGRQLQTPPSVDNPPFEPNADEINTVSSILTSWQPPDPFATQPRYKQIVSVDNPPGFINDYLTDPVDLPLPTLTVKYLQAPAAVVVNDPPFTHWGRLVNTMSVIASWQPPDPFPKQPKYQQVVSVDQPPFEPNVDEITFFNILTTWQPPDPQPQQKLKTQVVSVDAPPGFRPLLEDRVQIVSTWQPPDPFPKQPRYMQQISGAAVVVAYVPFTPKWLSGVVASWQPDVWPSVFVGGQQPYSQNKNAIKPGWSVDPPPGFINDYLSDLVDPVPFFYPRKLPIIPAAAVDNPPFTYRGRLALTASIIASWGPPDPQPFQKGPLPIVITSVPVNEPPYTLRGRTQAFASIVQSWQPPDPQPFQRGPLPIIVLAVRVDNPPFVLYGSNDWLVTVNASWQPPNPAPTQPHYTQISSVDNPPRYEGIVTDLYNVLQQSWLPPDPAPTQKRPMQISSVDAPPRPRGFTPYPITPDPQPTQPRPLYVPPSVVVTYTPYSNAWMTTVIAAWQPPNPQPFQRRPTFIAGMSVDNPPSMRTPGIMATWFDTPIAAQQQRAFVISVSQTPQVPAWFGVVVGSWQPEISPIILRRTLPIRVTAVPVDNPPFDMRRGVMPTTVQAWQPDPWVYSPFYMRGKFIPSTVARIVKHPTLTGTLTVATLIGTDGSPVLGGTKKTSSLRGSGSF